MSIEAPNWYIEQWKDGVLHHYQAKGFTLRNMTIPPVKMDGKTMYFLVAGVGSAEEDVQIGDVAVPYNNAREKVPVTTKKSRAFSEVYEDALDQMTPDEMQVENESASMALGRVHDKTIVNALEAAATKELGVYTDPIGLGGLLQARALLQQDDVPVEDGGIFALVDSTAWGDLLTYKGFSSADWVGPQLPYLQAGLAKTWNGINVVCISDSYFPLGAGATEFKLFMFHRQAVGFGFVRNLTGSVVWDNRKDCWTHNMRMRIGSKVILPKGVVRMKSIHDYTKIVAVK